MSTSPLRPEDTPFRPPTKFRMWAKFTDVINCAKFHLHWLSRFWAPGVRKSPFPIDLRYRSYNSVRTNVLHYDTVLRFVSDCDFTGPCADFCYLSHYKHFTIIVIVILKLSYHKPHICYYCSRLKDCANMFISSSNIRRPMIRYQIYRVLTFFSVFICNGDMRHG